MYQKRCLSICALPIICLLYTSHALLGREDADIKDIRTVYSHPQALMQTSQYLNAHRDWKQISTVNTAVAAKKVAEENDRSQAAVASEIAGELYGLKVLERSINHNKNNVTRFIILSKDCLLYTSCGRRWDV